MLRSLASSVARRLRSLGVQLLLSAAFVLVPFFFAACRLAINSVRKWQRDQVRLTGDDSGAWLQEELHRSERQRLDRVVEVWGWISQSITRRFRFGRGMPLDLMAWFRVMQRHSQLYDEMTEEARGCALAYGEVDALPSLTGHFAKDLLCAMRHSRAAYGYRQGRSLLECMLAWLYYRTKSATRFPEQVCAKVALEIARIEKGDMVAAEWSGGVYQPCFYVAIDRRHRLIVVAFRGTVNISDVLTDATSLPIEVMLDGQHGFLHEGMLRAAGAVLPRVRAALAEAAERAPAWPVLICGHSLGAGVAALLTLLLHLPQNQVHGRVGPMRCIAFGCPAVACEALSPLFQDLITSVVVGADVVPRFGHASTDELISEAAGLSALRRATSLAGHTLHTFVRRLPLPRQPLERQVTMTRQRTLAIGRPGADLLNRPVQLFPAGRILWAVPGEQPFVAECKLDWVQDFLLHLDFINHHTPDAYLQAVQAIGDALERAPSQAAYLQLERMKSRIPAMGPWLKLRVRRRPAPAAPLGAPGPVRLPVVHEQGSREGSGSAPQIAAPPGKEASAAMGEEHYRSVPIDDPSAPGSFATHPLPTPFGTSVRSPATGSGQPLAGPPSSDQPQSATEPSSSPQREAQQAAAQQPSHGSASPWEQGTQRQPLSPASVMERLASSTASLQGEAAGDNYQKAALGPSVAASGVRHTGALTGELAQRQEGAADRGSSTSHSACAPGQGEQAAVPEAAPKARSRVVRFAAEA